MLPDAGVTYNMMRLKFAQTQSGKDGPDAQPVCFRAGNGSPQAMACPRRRRHCYVHCRHGTLAWQLPCTFQSRCLFLVVSPAVLYEGPLASKPCSIRQPINKHAEVVARIMSGARNTCGWLRNGPSRRNGTATYHGGRGLGTDDALTIAISDQEAWLTLCPVTVDVDVDV
ncbi:hypothetical protein LX36DRAFT_298858 [Colletotrichum falcatum]|nr:hypothetical protein LX36DRAFT_298858 [Colletotrichum falcatum]